MTGTDAESRQIAAWGLKGNTEGVAKSSRADDFVTPFVMQKVLSVKALLNERQWGWKKPGKNF